MVVLTTPEIQWTSTWILQWGNILKNEASVIYTPKFNIPYAWKCEIMLWFISSLKDNAEFKFSHEDFWYIICDINSLFCNEYEYKLQMEISKYSRHSNSRISLHIPGVVTIGLEFNFLKLRQLRKIIRSFLFFFLKLLICNCKFLAPVNRMNQEMIILSTMPNQNTLQEICAIPGRSYHLLILERSKWGLLMQASVTLNFISLLFQNWILYIQQVYIGNWARFPLRQSMK